MSDRVVVNRRLEFRRGGSQNNVGGPVVTLVAQNKSSGTVNLGDIVILDTTNSSADVLAFTTTTTLSDPLVLGMVFDYSIANNAYGNIQVWGPTAALKVNGTTAISKGDLIGTYTSAKIGAKTTGVGAFATAMEAYVVADSSGVIDALIQNMNLNKSAFTAHDHSSTPTGGNLGDTTVGTALSFGDSVPINLGASDDVVIQWDGVDLTITAAAADSLIKIGSANQIDVQLTGNTTNDTVYFDGSANVLNLSDGVKLGLGNASTQPDVTVAWDGVDVDVLAQADDSIINFGNGTASFDVKIFGNTSDLFALWDASASILQLQDSVKLGFGNTSATPDVSINWDATNLQIAAAAANSVIVVGDANQMDVKLVGNTTDDSAYWDGSANTLGLTDGVKLGLGNNSTTPDVTIAWDGTDVDILAQTDDSVINFGNGTASFDVKLFGNTTDTFMLWDASADDLLIQDNTSIKFGTGNDVEIRWDSTDLDVLAVGDDLVINFGNGTNSFDIKTFGNTTDDFMLWDASASRLDLRGTAALRIASIGTLDFPAQAAGNKTFTVTGLTSVDTVVISPREATQGALVVDLVEAGKVTIRNTASESANVECNYLVIAKAS